MMTAAARPSIRIHQWQLDAVCVACAHRRQLLFANVSLDTWAMRFLSLTVSFL